MRRTGLRTCRPCRYQSKSGPLIDSRGPCSLTRVNGTAVSIPDDVLANKTDYQFNYNDDSEWTSSFTEFEDSSYYDEHYTSDSDSDSSYDWDSGDSWDSGTTDWDSDW